MGWSDPSAPSREIWKKKKEELGPLPEREGAVNAAVGLVGEASPAEEMKEAETVGLTASAAQEDLSRAASTRTTIVEAVSGTTTPHTNRDSSPSPSMISEMRKSPERDLTRLEETPDETAAAKKVVKKPPPPKKSALAPPSASSSDTSSTDDSASSTSSSKDDPKTETKTGPIAARKSASEAAAAKPKTQPVVGTSMDVEDGAKEDEASQSVELV